MKQEHETNQGCIIWITLTPLERLPYLHHIPQQTSEQLAKAHASAAHVHPACVQVEAHLLHPPKQGVPLLGTRQKSRHPCRLSRNGVRSRTQYTPPSPSMTVSAESSHETCCNILLPYSLFLFSAAKLDNLFRKVSRSLGRLRELANFAERFHAVGVSERRH